MFFQRGQLLAVIPSDALAAHVLPVLQQYTVTKRTDSLDEALALLDQRARWCGVVLDAEHTGDDTCAALRRLRAAHPSVELLVIGARGTLPAELVNLAHGQRAELICRPASESSLASFARRALTCAAVPDARVAARVDALAEAHAFTPRETQLTIYALSGEPRSQLPRRLGVSKNTLKTQIRGLLRKCGAANMDQLANRLLRDALHRHSRPARELTERGMSAANSM